MNADAVLNLPHELWTPERGFRAATWREMRALGLAPPPISGGAGAYPDVPSYQMAYDRDGTAVVAINVSGGNSATELTGAQKATINDEDADTVSVFANPQRMVFIFPERRNVLGYFVRTGAGGVAPGSLEKSVDTTNGVDGTWSTVLSPWINAGNFAPDYRSAIQTVSALNVIAVRFNATTSDAGIGWALMHLYGPIEAAAVQWLKFWHATLDQEIAAAAGDWGNTPRGSSADRTFRIKNRHATLTANNVVLSVETLSDTVPTVSGQYLLSTDGSTFTASINIGSLAPGATSGVLTIRRNTPSNAVLSVWRARVIAAANSWS